MKNLQLNFYQCWVGQGELDQKSLNSSPPHYLCGAGKICVGRSGKGRGKITILSTQGRMRSQEA